MGGFFGAVSSRDVSLDVFFGVDYHYHLGTTRGGMVVYDEEKGFYRTTNRAGGLEGGMSNVEEIVLRAAMKPIPTLMKGLKTVDYSTKEEATAASERSDVCAIFALEIIAEAVVAEVLANAVAKRLGGDTMQEVKERYERLK